MQQQHELMQGSLINSLFTDLFFSVKFLTAFSRVLSVFMRTVFYSVKSTFALEY